MPKKEKLPKEKKPPKQAKHEKQQKKRKGRSVQDFIGVKTFTKYGLMTQKGELLFYLVSPTNISVLSYVNIEIKIRHLMMVLSSVPDIEITCTDSSECFDDNKAYLHERLEYEQNPKVRKLIKKDIEFLDNVQVEMATARQLAESLPAESGRQLLHLSAPQRSGTGRASLYEFSVSPGTWS